jgi:DedD protein
VDTSKPKPLSTSAGLDAKEEVVPDTKPEPKVEAKPKAEVKPEAALAAAAGVVAVVPKAEAKPEAAKAEPQATAKPETKPAEVKPATKPTDSKDTGARFVVQAGTFSDEAKLRETRSKLEKAGITTYTQVIEGKDGRRVRVRVGPFTKRDDADKMANKIKQLQLQPQVLTL